MKDAAAAAKAAQEAQAEEFRAALAKANTDREEAIARAEAAEKATPTESVMDRWSADLLRLRAFSVRYPGVLLTEVGVPYEHDDIPAFHRTSGYTARVVQGVGNATYFKTAEGDKVTL